MQTFLEEVTNHVLTKYEGKTGELCIVTPNRRAGIFFRKHFAARVKKPLWAPEFLSIEDFINELTGLNICDSISLLFEFYEVYCRIEGENTKTIDEFIRWAPVLLKDFDDLDAGLENPDTLFEHLHDVKYIETWNPDGTPLTDFQINYLEFFGRLRTYHNELKAHLLKKNLAYQGLSSRQAAESIKKGSTGLPWEKVIFTGFNAFNQAEEMIADTLLSRQQAEILTEADAYYLENTMHEAGSFIRKYAGKWGLKTPATKTSFFREQKKNIQVLGIAKNVNQARLAGNLLEEETGLSNDENTALVLANENLLIPVLNALPEKVKNVNVTMGYPLQKTNLFGFFDALLQIRLSMQRFRQGRKGKVPGFYHKDIIRFFNHTAAALFWHPVEGENLCAALVQNILASNSTFLQFEDLAALSEDAEGFSGKFAFLAREIEGEAATFFHSLLALTEQLDQAFRQKATLSGKDVINTPYFADFEALYYFASIFRRLESLFEKFPFLESSKTLYSLFKQTTAETRLAFSGEPLQGLQIMGMLETRNLDFKNVILLSANEDILPKPKRNNSFIPFDVRKKFGLQVHSDKDAIYAYHFYRLLQRAENIFLVYNTQTQDLGSSEKSRFITQLQYELEKYNPQITIKETVVSLPPPAEPEKDQLTIHKTPDIMERLREMSQRGFSPSALSRYVDCPLRFYLEKVARLEEAEKVEETMEAQTLGSVVHEVLESLYRPFVKKILTPAAIQKMLTRVETVTREQFRKIYPGGNVEEGKNLLLYHVAKRHVINSLKAEKNHLEKLEKKNQHLTILSLEEKMSHSLDIPGEQGGQVNISGKADRIDRVGDIIRVIDYKTGQTKPVELSFKEWDEPFSKGEKGKSFQLLVYAWLYHRENPDAENVEPGILSMRSLGMGSQTLVFPEGKGSLRKEHIGDFEKGLKTFIGGIMDPEVPFSRTEDENNCRWCTFNSLCRRF